MRKAGDARTDPIVTSLSSDAGPGPPDRPPGTPTASALELLRVTGLERFKPAN